MEKEKKLLEVKMNNGSMSFEKLQEAAERVNEIIVLLDKKEMRWLELSERRIRAAKSGTAGLMHHKVFKSVRMDKSI